MKTEYRVVSAEWADQDNVRVVVEIMLRSVINGYGGGQITITVPAESYQEEIMERVLRKLGQGVAPQVHEFVLDGDMSKVEALTESYRQAKEEARAREAAQREAEARASEEAQTAESSEARVEETQEVHAEVVDEVPSDLPVAVENAPLT